MRDDDTTYSKPAADELRDVHHRLDKLDEHLSSLKESVANDRIENLKQFAAVREAVASKGRFPAWAVGLVGLGAVQIGAQVYFNGELKGDNRRIGDIAMSALAKIEGQRESASEWERTIAVNSKRLEMIEKRNEIADKNWDSLKSKGFLVERPKQ